MNPNLLDALAQYIRVLAASMQKAQDPSFLYVDHLAAAALIFQSLHRSDFQQALRQVAEEQRQYGWSFLPGEEGGATEAAFARFATAIRRTFETQA
jgi:hypothetical protein